MDSVILIDKPAGMTSFGVVARLRRVLSERAGKKIKVGHCGTLDPFATGLLVIVTGAECRKAMQYTKQDKTYKATFILGKTSTTGDPEGDITPIEVATAPDKARIQAVLHQFVGRISQQPPMFSAIKINGQRAYKLARGGKSIELPQRIVTIHKLELLDYSYPELTICAQVSSGTYIRSLAADIGEALGTGGYCQQLRRMSIASWQVDDAKQLSDFGISD